MIYYGFNGFNLGASMKKLTAPLSLIMILLLSGCGVLSHYESHDENVPNLYEEEDHMDKGRMHDHHDDEMYNH